MTPLLHEFATWLADYYLLASVLLLFAVSALLFVRQPANRRAITHSTLIGLTLLAALCAVPGWSLMSLTASQPAVRSNAHSEPFATESPLPFKEGPGEGSWSTEPDTNFKVDSPSVNATSSSPKAPPHDIPWPMLAVIAWTTGAVCVVAWLGIGLWAAHCLRRDSKPAPAAYIAMLRDCEVTALRRPTELFTSTRIDVAVALGIWRPAVLLPAKWIPKVPLPIKEEPPSLPLPFREGLGEGSFRTPPGEGLSRDELRTVLAHEAAHIRNHDLQWLAVSRALNVLLWAQPLFWLVRRRMRLDQEALADAAAAELTSRGRYAEKLVALAHLAAGRPAMRLSSAVGLWEGSSQLRRRVSLLIDEHFIVLRNCSRRLRLSATLTALAAASGLSLITLEAKTQAETTPTNNVSENNPATENATSPAAADKKLPAPNPAAEVVMDSLRVRIVNVEGKPIENATIKPYGLRFADRSAHLGWFKEQPGFGAPQESTSDQSGIAAVKYPRFIGGKAQMKTSIVSVQVSHPDHVATSQDVEVSPNPTTIRLPSGGTVEIVVTSNGKAIRDDIFAQGGGWGGGLWKQLDDGTLRSPRILPGRAAVRAVYLPKDGAAQFSPLTAVDVAENLTQKIEVELQPGARLTGKLDDAVPRPVKNGKVIAIVEMPGHVDWCDWAPVQEDGTYEFVSLPRTEAVLPQPVPDENGWSKGQDATVNGVQLIAIVDGFVSKPPQWDSGDRTGKPQVVPLNSDSVSYDIPMLATATVKLLFTEADGRPIPDTHVSFAPNVHWSIGSNLFGENAFRTGEALRDPAVSRATSADSNKFHVTSNEKGLAEIKDLPPFEPRMAFIHHEQFQLPASAMMMAGTTRAATVDFKPGEVTELELVLEPTEAAIAEQQVAETELAGTVLGPDGKPLADVTVDVWTWYLGNETKTDSRGRFRLKGFEPNEHLEVEFRKPGYEPRLFYDFQAGTPNWTIPMGNRTFLEGTVTDPQGRTVANAVIRAERGPFQNEQVTIGEVATETRTDKEGRYRLYLEPATYSIKIRVPDRGVARFDGQPIAADEQKNFDIQLKDGITFRANVVDSETGKPVKDIRLFNWRLKGIEGVSNDEGILEIPGLFPGKIELQVRGTEKDYLRSSVAGQYARWWSDAALQQHQRKEPPGDQFQRNLDDLEFEISDKPEPVTIYVEPCVTITGRVVDPDGKPVADATVAPAKTGSGNSLTGDTRYSYETKQDGTFEMKLPASGTFQYNLIAHDGKYLQWRNWANAIGEPFSTKPGEKIENVELRLVRPATIRGRVLIDGEPAVRKEVRAADVLNRDNRYYVPTTKTDDEGHFELKFVGPGERYVQAEPFWLNPAEAPADSSTRVKVEEGATIDDVELQIKTQPNVQFPFPAVQAQ